MTDTRSPATRPAHVPDTWMPAETMADYVAQRLEDKVVDSSVAYGQLTVTVVPEALPTAAQLCKHDPALGFDFFDFMAGVDLRDEGFAVVTSLYSVRHRHRIFLRVIAVGGRDNPTLPTITHVYRGADWHEREAYDMFGITFEGHPGLLPRILTVENFEGWPLRKEFLLSTREAKPWPGFKEPKPAEEEAENGQAAPRPSAEEKARPSAEEKAGPSAEEKVVPSADDKAAAAKAKAERAKEKAAAMRAKKAQEQAADQRAEAAGQHVDAPRPEATTATGEEAVAPGKSEQDRPAAAGEDDEQADAARQTAGGDTEGAAAAAAAVAEGDAAAQTPEGAADIAGSDIAKDAAAGAPSGDTAKGASQDAPGYDQPVSDPDEEARVAEGAKATPSGTPGVEEEGRHEGAERQGAGGDVGGDPGDAEDTDVDDEGKRS